MPRFSPFETDVETCSFFQEMFHGKLALIGEWTTMRFVFYSKCNLTQEQGNQVQVLMNPIFGTQMHFWPTKDSYFLTEEFSKGISVLRESGLIFYWQNVELDYKISGTGIEKTNVKFKTMSINKLILPLTLLFMGITAAFLVFLSELRRRKSPEH
ncbi:unnamed protein product [Phyllotreta striolata]|uniref:Uncharacterized protein n=1 Tax=Phyllotreta striolata TaxID=444603 RepID=A0A9N9TR96_PHYSR|nr:unnamed protein product [Phyllotreta striolata]